VQKAMLFDLLEAAKHTQLGKAHHFGEIKSYADFAARVPLFDYESFTPYLEKTIKEKDTEIKEKSNKIKDLVYTGG
jgi:hypothetical protein